MGNREGKRIHTHIHDSQSNQSGLLVAIHEFDFPAPYRLHEGKSCVQSMALITSSETKQGHALILVYVLQNAASEMPEIFAHDASLTKYPR